MTQPTIPLSDYKIRREQLFESLPPESVLIIPSAEEVKRNGDTDFLFRQNSDFYYLTGFNEPEAVCVLSNKDNQYQFILFTRPSDPKMEVWNGSRAGLDGAKNIYGANASFNINNLAQELIEILKNTKNIYYPLDQNKSFSNLILDTVNHLNQLIRSGVTAPSVIQNSNHLIHPMRLIKSPNEINCMRMAAEISVEAHKELIKKTKPDMNECELDGLLNYHFRKNHCNGPAYPSIVGGGANACILHYINNNCDLKSGDLLLVDAGGEYQNYASDITRTYPVNGKFTNKQKDVYNIVLESQLAAIDLVKPGLAWPDIQTKIITILTNGLVKLGLLAGEVDDLIESKAYQQYYMHNSGHWLGLDTHDVGEYKNNNGWTILQPGMVLTIEPGLYIPEWNMGIRIEDDILVTESGYEILSKAVPKSIEDIERLMAA